MSSNTKVKTQRFDPYKNFRFKVKWSDSTDYVLGISKVSILKRSTELVEHREGGTHGSGRKFPGRTSYEAITLERGVTYNRDFESWANKVFEYKSGIASPNYRKNLMLDVFNEAGQLVRRYNIYECWVSEYQSLPELDANANAIAIESIKLEHEGWERDTAVREPIPESTS